MEGIWHKLKSTFCFILIYKERFNVNFYFHDRIFSVELMIRKFKMQHCSGLAIIFYENKSLKFRRENKTSIIASQNIKANHAPVCK